MPSGQARTVWCVKAARKRGLVKKDFSISMIRKRLSAIVLAITFLFIVFLSRFFYVQVLWEDSLKILALDQWTREIPVKPERGRITDRNGELLAGNQTKYGVFARANAVKDKEYTATFLSAALGLDKGEILEKLNDKSKSEVTILRKAEKEQVQKIAGANLSGVYYARDNARIYPYGSLACQTLGFTSVDQAGASGVEKYYDTYLAGSAGEILYETDLVGVDIKGSAASYYPAQNGLNLRLTLDYKIQALTEEVMGRALTETKAKGVRAVVLDPQNGEILSLVNLPSYDLNAVPRDNLASLNALTRNRLVSDAYEPGSTFKIVTALADIEEHLKGNPAAFSTSHVFSSARTRTVDGSTIRCWSDHKNGKHSNETLADALNNSCNPCFVDIALALGKDTFYDYLQKFRFGQTTGVDFSGEAIGMLLPKNSVKNADLARIGFGQAIAVTPLQLAAAAAAAVNGGNYYAPRLVSEIYSEERGISERVEKTLVGNVASKEASEILASMLEGVVRDGSGKHAYIEGYRVGGKTGTAQKYENGQIASGKYVSSFVGFFPANKPEYLALIIVDEPEGSYYGSTVAAPLAKEIFEGIISFYDLPPCA